MFFLNRWSFVLSRGGSLFLEPDADMEDSKSHCLVCTLWPNCGLSFKSFFFALSAVLCLHDFHIHPELLPQHLSRQPGRSFEPGSHQLWTLWDQCDWCEMPASILPAFFCHCIKATWCNDCPFFRVWPTTSMRFPCSSRWELWVKWYIGVWNSDNSVHINLTAVHFVNIS